MASASGSQTDNGGDESDSEVEDPPDILPWRTLIRDGSLFLHPASAGTAGRRLSSGSGAAVPIGDGAGTSSLLSVDPMTAAAVGLAPGWAGIEGDTPPPTASLTGELGRGDRVLADRRTTQGGPQHSSQWRTYSAERDTSPMPSKRRPPSARPANAPTTSSRSVSKIRRVARTNSGNSNAEDRDASPEPLTLDSIQTTYNPFPLVQKHLRFRTSLVPEVILLCSALCLALYRLESIDPAILPVAASMPIPLLGVLAAVIPLIALFRSRDSYLKVPFTDERGYRSPVAADDGVAAALALPLLLASACLWDTYWSHSLTPITLGLEETRPLVDIWETSGINAKPPLATPFTISDTAQVLMVARSELVLLTALNSAVLILHLGLAKTFLRIERLPKGNAKRFVGFNMLAWGVSAVVYASFAVWDWSVGLPISPLEAGLATLIQQSSFYLVSRLARRGFTLGELTTMTTAGNALVLEFWRLSRSRWLYKRGRPMIPQTFREPTALLVFQTVLIPGAFLSGFLLSPLLVISRHIAQKPSHRLKWPTERERHRRLLAAGVFLGLFGIVFFALGGWVGWELGGSLRRPWLWALAFIWYGGDGVNDGPQPKGWQSWKRLVLVSYWAATIVVAVGGWQTRLVRARRIRMNGTSSNPTEKTVVSTMRVENAREEKRMHASLNMRRKFFHGLAVTMFVPAIAIDPAFTSLGFSVAFALFVFCEYARYFALYPVGAPLHIFFSEFVDNKDSGPVILSHFYLLSGCASGLWLEGRGINRFTGVLVLGIGDAMASVVGKLIGWTKWPGTTKTVEGTIAFVVSIIFSAWVLRLVGWVPDFSIPRYAIATTGAALLEAFSTQNDNLVIPVYMWSLVTLLKV